MSGHDSIPLPEDSGLDGGDTVMMDYGLYDAQSHAAAPASTQPPAPTLGLLEVLDKNGNVVNQLTITHWPVTVGRALSANLVIDDVHIAPEHLRINALDAACVVVEVLDTINGLRRGYGTLMERGMRFDWTGSDELALGRLRLRLRLPSTPLAPERPLPAFPWKTVGLTVALVLAVLASVLLEVWFKTPESAKFVQVALQAVAMLMGGMAVWAGAWAFATKLFTGHMQFLKHVRIACGAMLADELVSGLAYLLAYMFSWESLARFNGFLSAPVLGAGIFLHLLVLTPQRRKGLMLFVAGAVLLVVLALVGSNWQKNKRVSNTLYLSALFPPSWRLANAVPLEQWMGEAQSIQQRLAKRLQDQADDEQGDVQADDGEAQGEPD